MSLLINTSDVIEALGLNTSNESDIEGTVGRAIRAAQTRAEVSIGSALERFTNREVFFINQDLFNGVTENGLLCLRLKNGFAQLTGVGSSYTPNSYDPLDLPGVSVNEQYGFVYLPTSYDKQYVEVTYTSGFLDRASAPQEVKQAILYFVPLALKLSMQPDAETKKKADESAKISEALVESLRRPTGVQYRPFLFTRTPLAA